MIELFKIVFSWQFILFCFVFIGMIVVFKKFNRKPKPIDPDKEEARKLFIHQLNKGILGLTSSRKGALCMMLFFCSLIPMTVLCLLGRIDGTAYGICLSAVTTAVVAVFCHTQSQTDQILGAPQAPLSSMQTTIGSDGGVTQNITSPNATINSLPIIPLVSGIGPQTDAPTETVVTTDITNK